jgi:prepilin peptidase CpaA
MMTVHAAQVPLIIVSAACVVAAVVDAWKFRVPNLLTLSLFVSGLAFHVCVGGFSGLGESVKGAALGFALLIVVHATGGMGAGDVKLGAAVGAWLGATTTFHVLIVASIAGGVFALILILAARVASLLGLREARGSSIFRPPADASTTKEALRRPDRRLRIVPFGAMIAVGVAAVCFGF